MSENLTDKEITLKGTEIEPLEPLEEFIIDLMILLGDKRTKEEILKAANEQAKNK